MLEIGHAEETRAEKPMARSTPEGEGSAQGESFEKSSYIKCVLLPYAKMLHL